MRDHAMVRTDTVGFDVPAPFQHLPGFGQTEMGEGGQGRTDGSRGEAAEA